MKKVITINFCNTLLTIEEEAYEALREYRESLSKYFRNEASCEEILKDIDFRITEILSEILKKENCITDRHIQYVINEIGSPSDFANDGLEIDDDEGQETTSDEQKQEPEQYVIDKLFRSADDKVFAGVCSGLGTYFKTDPIIFRILFALLQPLGIIAYCIIWILAPARSLKNNNVKRLYRDTQHRVLGGVVAGISHYTNMNRAALRILLAILVLAPSVLLLSTSELFFINVPILLPFIYLIMWIGLPPTRSASDRLQMKGEKVNAQTIKKNVYISQNDTKGLHRDTRNKVIGGVMAGIGQYTNISRALLRIIALVLAFLPPILFPNAGMSINSIPIVMVLYVIMWISIPPVDKGVSRQQTSDQNKGGGEQNRSTAMIAYKAPQEGRGHNVAKSIILILLWMIGLSFVFPSVATYLISSVVSYSIFDGFMQYANQAALILFFILPLVVFFIWLIRSSMVKRNSIRWFYLSSFGLWLLSSIYLAFAVLYTPRLFIESDFETKEIATISDSIVTMNSSRPSGDMNFFDAYKIFYKFSPYSDNSELLLPFNSLGIIRSQDSLFHVYEVKFTRGKKTDELEENLSRIDPNISINGDKISFNGGTIIRGKGKYRLQTSMIVVAVPKDKKLKTGKLWDIMNVRDIRNVGVSKNDINNAKKELGETKDWIGWRFDDTIHHKEDE